MSVQLKNKTTNRGVVDILETYVAYKALNVSKSQKCSHYQ